MYEHFSLTTLQKLHLSILSQMVVSNYTKPFYCYPRLQLHALCQMTSRDGKSNCVILNTFAFLSLILRHSRSRSAKLRLLAQISVETWVNFFQLYLIQLHIIEMRNILVYIPTNVSHKTSDSFSKCKIKYIHRFWFCVSN